MLGEGDHYELFVNPYAGKDGKHRLLVTAAATAPSRAGSRPQDKLERHPLTELESSLPITGVVLRFLARHLPALMAKRFDARARRTWRDDGYANVSYKVFNIGEANHLPAVLDGARRDARGRPPPRGRRPDPRDRRASAGSSSASSTPRRSRCASSAPSNAYASMMHGQPTMMIELIMVADSRGGDALLAGYEQRLADLGVRPHWGQINALTPERVSELYPALGHMAGGRSAGSTPPACSTRRSRVGLGSPSRRAAERRLGL